ncbi:MAG TPA: hypothetical protein VGP63_13230 [Planctomycetaceae bacterium]|jgi:phage FluMu protein Com|nr:hypothetical protein [Planctomycetaceae bacterium]
MNATMVTLRCPHCDQLLTTEQDKIGKVAQCPKCGKTFTLTETTPEKPAETVEEPASLTTTATQLPKAPSPMNSKLIAATAGAGVGLLFWLIWGGFFGMVATGCLVGLAVEMLSTKTQVNSRFAKSPVRFFALVLGCMLLMVWTGITVWYLLLWLLPWLIFGAGVAGGIAIGGIYDTHSTDRHFDSAGKYIGFTWRKTGEAYAEPNPGCARIWAVTSLVLYLVLTVCVGWTPWHWAQNDRHHRRVEAVKATVAEGNFDTIVCYETTVKSDRWGHDQHQVLTAGPEYFKTIADANKWLVAHGCQSADTKYPEGWHPEVSPRWDVEFFHRGFSVGMPFDEVTLNILVTFRYDGRDYWYSTNSKAPLTEGEESEVSLPEQQKYIDIVRNPVVLRAYLEEQYPNKVKSD